MNRDERSVASLKRRTATWAAKLRVTPRAIRIQPMSRKWGSCSSAGTVTLAHDLAHQSVSFQDLVIVHELLHLRVKSHGRLFKTLMTAYLPGWREIELTSPGHCRNSGTRSGGRQ